MVCVSEDHSSTTSPNSMTKHELTLDQLQTISGGWKFGRFKVDYRQQRPKLHGYISEPDVGTSRPKPPTLHRFISEPDVGPGPNRFY